MNAATLIAALAMAACTPFARTSCDPIPVMQGDQLIWVARKTECPMKAQP